MPKSGTFGSGRGVSGNGHPYRDHNRSGSRAMQLTADLPSVKPGSISKNVCQVMETCINPK